MSIIPALITHLIHNEKLDLSLSVVAIGLIGAGNLICSLGPTYFNSVGLSILNELIASGVTLEILEEVLKGGMICKLAHPTKDYKWDQYEFTLPIRVLVELVICWKTSIVAEKYGFVTSLETGEEDQQQAFDAVKSMVDSNKLFKSLLA
jgi:hypothetical protein